MKTKGKPMLKTREVAQMLGVTSGTIRRYCASNRIPHLVISGGTKHTYRFKWEEIEEFIARGKEGREDK